MKTNQQITKPKADKESLLYRFLVSPSYRVARHMVLIVSIAAISLSQNAHAFLKNADEVGNFIYLIALITFILYMAVGYLHIYVLVPKFLMQKKYLRYIILSSITVFLLVFLKPFHEYWVNSYLDLPHTRVSYFNIVSFLDTLSDFMLNMLCITGASVTVLLQHWMIESKQVNELEKHHLQQEVNTMKDQINPELLFNTLNRTGNLAESDPDKAAKMVLQLSQLLRYQLYDGSRDKVLLRSEIDFLKNYLISEQFYNDNFDYNFSEMGDISRTMIPPLLFTPFAQIAVKAVRKNEERTLINLLFEVGKEHINFTCSFISSSKFSVSDFSETTKRLTHLFRKNYTFSVKENKDTKETLINLHLKSGSYE